MNSEIDVSVLGEMYELFLFDMLFSENRLQLMSLQDLMQETKYLEHNLIPRKKN